MTCASLTLGLHLATWHWRHDSDLRALNPGVYVACDDNAAGMYRNSLARPSVYFAHSWHVAPVDIAAGIVSGYRHPVTPIIVPSVLVADHVRLSLIPPMRATDMGGIHLSVETTWR